MPVADRTAAALFCTAVLWVYYSPITTALPWQYAACCFLSLYFIFEIFL